MVDSLPNIKKPGQNRPGFALCRLVLGHNNYLLGKGRYMVRGIEHANDIRSGLQMARIQDVEPRPPIESKME